MKTIIFKTRDEWTRVPLSKVLFVQANGNYCEVFYNNGRHISLLCSLHTLAKLLVEEMPHSFVVVSRSLIVNVSHVSQVNLTKKIVILADDTRKEVVRLQTAKQGITKLMEQLNANIDNKLCFNTSNGKMEAFIENSLP